VETYGFYGLSDTESVLMGQNLSRPALNITAFYLIPSQYSTQKELFGYDWIHPISKQKPFQDRSQLAMAALNHTYSLDWIRKNGQCQPNSDEYQWGFSFIQLFLLTLAVLIWTGGIWIMWLKAHLQLPLVGQSEVPCGWRCVIELAEAMSQEFRETNIDPRALTDRQLKALVYKQMRGGAVGFSTPLTRNGYGFRKGFVAWLKKDRWWLVAFGGVSAGLLPITITWPFWRRDSSGFTTYHVEIYIFFMAVVPGLAWGLIFAMLVGRSNRSRSFLVFCWVAVSVAVGLGMVSWIEVLRNRGRYY
jgi:hypothetical protein